VIASLPEIQDIAIGDNFMIALSKDQRVYGWGSNSAGQLGLGHLKTVTSPEPISLSSKINNIAGIYACFSADYRWQGIWLGE
jgi:alpha-tubulin suppressor-like RCC1 family protein